MSSIESVLMEKASAALDQATLLLGAGHFDGAADRAYYAMFHAVSALLRHHGMTFASHRGLHSAFGKEFAKTDRIDPKYHRMLLNAFDLRQTADYGAEADIDPATANRVCEEAADFVDMVRREMTSERSA